MKHGLVIGILAASLALASCGSDGEKDDAANPGDGDGDGAADGSPGDGDGSPLVDAGGDEDMDAGSHDSGADAGPGIAFTVPTEGGTVELDMPSGEKVSFEFPASAAGQAVQIAPTTTAPEGWEAADFAALIALSPDGLTFDEPVRVTLGSGALMALNFPHGSQVPDPLALSEDKQALLLTHFSTLALVDPALSCQSESGWRDEVDSASCTEHGTATSYRSFGCKNYQYCYVFTAGCCVEPGDTSVGCKVDSPNVSLDYVRTDSNGGAYPYCDAAEPDGGASACIVPGVDSAPGICREKEGGGCECVMDRDDGTGYKTYTMTCEGSVCECRLDGSLKSDGAASGVCDSLPAMQLAYQNYCCPSF